jgi:myo-inositol-1(or 4)-monophosphatase
MTDSLSVAEDIARAAGALLLEGFGASPAAPMLGRRQRFDAKSSTIDLVTEFDRRAEALILERIRAAYPADVILAEESGLSAPREEGVARWLVDPLDGTTNFAHGLPMFCVSIAREVGGVIESGVVHAPALGLTFTARRGGGAFLNGQSLRVSDAETLGRSMLATGFPYDRATSPDNNFSQFAFIKQRSQAVRRLGSAAIDLALVAAGTYDGYWEMKLKPWDMAAGSLLVEEAGGRVTGWLGEAFSVDRAAAVATNGRIHDELVAALREVGVPEAATR